MNSHKGRTHQCSRFKLEIGMPGNAPLILGLGEIKKERVRPNTKFKG